MWERKWELKKAEEEEKEEEEEREEKQKESEWVGGGGWTDRYSHKRIYTWVSEGMGERTLIQLRYSWLLSHLK